MPRFFALGVSQEVCKTLAGLNKNDFAIRNAGQGHRKGRESKLQGKCFALTAALSALTLGAISFGSAAKAETFSLRIATGHPPGDVYAA